MALFPSSPTNGQQVTVNGITYTYNSSQTAWIRTGASISEGDLTVNGNLTVSGNSTLGSNANVKISGGTSGYVLSTDGASNLSWVAQTGGGATDSISNGTSNVKIATSGGNVTTSVAGNANVLTVTGTGANVNGTVQATRFISNVATGTAPLVVTSTTLVANLNAMQVDGYDASQPVVANTIAVRNADGNLSANFFIGNGSQLTGIITSVSNVSNGTSNLNIPVASGNVNISAAGNANILTVFGTGVNVSGTLNTTGNVTAGNLYANSGTIGAGNIAGTITSGFAAQPNITSLGTLTGLGVNGTITAVNITANTGVFTGNGNGLSSIQGSNITGTVANANYATYSGTASTANSVAGANVSGTVANANYAAYAGNIVTASQPNITSVGTLTSLTVGGNITPNANITYDLGNNTNRFRDLYLANSTIYIGSQTISANATAVSISGNLSANLVGNISGSLVNGNSNVSIPSANGNVNISAAGNTTLVVTGTGANITGTLGTTGNIDAPNVRASNEVYTSILSLNTGGVTLPADVGDIIWDDMVKTVSIRLENGEMLHLGQEINYLVQANTNLTRGQVVTFVGVSSNVLLGDPANLQSAGFIGDYVMGIAGSNITAGNLGYVTSFGEVHDIDTNSFNVGDILYASPSTPGGLTNTIPTGANAKVQVGAVVHKGTIDGVIFARTNFFPKLNQLSGVSSTNATNNQYLRYNNSSSVWEPANLQISNDPSPNLGANLNANNFSFTNVNDITANTANFDGAVYSNAAVTNSLQLATKQYVDQATSAGLHIHQPVRVEAPNALTATYTQGGTTPTITTISGGNTLTTSTTHGLAVNDIIVFGSSTNGLTAGTAYVVYSVPASNQITLSLSYGPGTQVTGLTNGTGLSITSRANAGVGATLTNAGTQAALVLGGVTMAVNDRVLVYKQTNAFENGVYTVTNIGSGSTNWVLTRALDQDTYAPQDTNGMGAGDYFYIQEGTGAGESYVMSTDGIIIIGTTNITYTLFSASVAYTGVSPVVVSGQFISLANTTGSGDFVVLANTPTLIAPNIGAATGTSLNVSTGNVSAGNLNATVANITGNVLAGNVFANSGNVNANIYLGGRISVGGNIDGGDFNSSGNLIASGNVTGANLSTAGILSVTGNANIGNLGTAQVLATANVTAPQLISNVASGTAPLVVTSNTVVTNLNADLLDGYNSATANTANTVAVRDTNGNISANFFIGNGSQLTGITAAGGSNISNGTSNVSIATSGGNVTVGVGGTANVLTATTSGVVINGAANVNGNANTLAVLANFYNANTGTLASGALTVGANGIASGGTITVAGQVGQATIAAGTNSNLVLQTGSTTRIHMGSGNANVGIANTAPAHTLSIGGTLNASGNANVGNLGTGVVLATSNITGDNVFANANLYTPSISTTATNGNVNIDPNGTGFAVFTSTTPVIIANSTTQTTAGLQLTGAPLATNNDFGLLHVGNASLTFNDTDIIAVVTANANSYAQMIFQNQSANNTASADFIVNNDTTGGTTVYGDFGINSTTFAASGPFGGANTTYVYSAGGNMSVGTLNSFPLQLATANTTRITIDAGGNTNVAGNLNFTGAKANLGSNANVIITGGSSGQVLSTDGAGNLSWTSAGGGGGGASIANGTSNVDIATADGNVTVSVGGTANVATFTSSNVIIGTGSSGNIIGANVISATTLQGFVQPSAGTTTVAPFDFTAGSLLSTPLAGSMEYDGTALYGTDNATSGRGVMQPTQMYRYTTAGSALGSAIADYFPTNSSLNLQATSIYDIEAVAYFLKTTAGTVTFTWAFSSGVNFGRSYYTGSPATGFTTTTVTGTPVTGQAVARGGAVTTLAHAATGSLTTAVYHAYHFKLTVYTNAACNFRLRVTNSAGTVTPQPGSYYIVRKLPANAGVFAA